MAPFLLPYPRVRFYSLLATATSRNQQAHAGEQQGKGARLGHRRRSAIGHDDAVELGTDNPAVNQSVNVEIVYALGQCSKGDVEREFALFTAIVAAEITGRNANVHARQVVVGSQRHLAVNGKR